MQRYDYGKAEDSNRIGQVTGHAEVAGLPARRYYTVVDHRSNAAVAAEAGTIGHGHLAGERCQGGTVAHLQHSLFHRHRTAERLVAGQQQSTEPALGQPTGTTEQTIEAAIGILLEHQQGTGRPAYLQVVSGRWQQGDQLLVSGDGASLAPGGLLQLKAVADSELLLFDLP